MTAAVPAPELSRALESDGKIQGVVLAYVIFPNKANSQAVKGYCRMLPKPRCLFRGIH